MHINLSSSIWSVVDDGTSGDGGNGTGGNNGNSGENSGTATSYIVGNLQSVDALGFTVTIDGKTYSVADDFAMNLPAQILWGDGSKAVACTLSYGKIAKMERAENLIEPIVNIVNKGNDIVYQNGAFNENAASLQVRVTCGVKKPYNISDFKGIADLGLSADKMKVTVPEAILNFGESGLINKKKITEKEENINQFMKSGDSLLYDYTVNLEETYTPPANAKTEIELNVVATINGWEYNFTEKLLIVNLDYQRQRAEQKKAQSDAASKLTQAKKELQNLCNGSTLTLGVDLSYYLQPDQIQQVKEYLYVWLAEVNNANTYTDDKNINKKIMEKLGINPNVGFLWRQTRAETQVVIGTVYGQKTFEFTLTLGTLQSNGTAYGSFGDIKYEVLEKDNVPKSIPTDGVLGVSTYVSMDKFIQCLQDVAESSVKDVYKELWGKNANEVASIIVDKTIMKIIDKKYGSFSNGVYTIMTNPAKNYVKKVKVECPVDVYIYDMDDNLCGAITDNVVDSDYSDIAMYVEGDTKVFYLTGDDYKLKLVGNDTGTMTYTIEELGDNMANFRTVQFKDIPLADGMTYTGYVMEPPYIDNVLYALNTEDEQTIPADIDTYQDNLTKRVYTDGINLDTSAKTLHVGESFRLHAAVTPADATNQKNKWVSSSTDIATVDDMGKVTAVKEGTANITAVSDDGEFESTCQITVVKSETDDTKNAKVKISGLSITAPSKKLAAGKKVKLTLTITPKNAANKSVTWKTSNSKYAAIDKNGKVTLKKAGVGKNVTITATANDGSGKKAKIKIKIMQHAVKSIKLNASAKTLKAGKSLKMKATVKTTGKNANKTLKWTSSNPNYATVNKSGKVTAKKAGKNKTVTITASSTDGSNKKARIKITIK